MQYSKIFSASDTSPLLFFCHGLGGCSKDTNRYISPSLPLNEINVVYPQGPISLHGGNSLGTPAAWFFQNKDDDIQTDLLVDSLAQLHELILNIPVEYDLNPSKIVLAGFSQGGTVSVSYGLRYPGSVDNTICIAGYVPNDPRFQITKDSVRDTEFHWYHGQKDYENPHYLMDKAIPKFMEAEANFHWHSIPDVGHTIPIQAMGALGALHQS